MRNSEKSEFPLTETKTPPSLPADNPASSPFVLNAGSLKEDDGNSTEIYETRKKTTENEERKTDRD